MKHKLSFIVALWWVILCLIGGVFLLGTSDKQPRLSESENRMLAGFPKLSAASLASGEFMTDFESFLSDAFFGRDALVRTSDRLLGAFSVLSRDDQLAAAAVPLVGARRWFLTALSREAAAQYAAISENPDEPFALSYAGPLARADDPCKAMLEGLRRARREDTQRMYTTFGPHRDDLALSLCGRDLRAFGSQGQQRSSVLALKLAEASLLREMTGENPIALLDDVMSELDEKRQDYILNHIKDLQVFITCCDKETVLRLKKGKTFHIANGALSEG